MAFRKYHLLHHQHLGEYEMDPDIVCHTEGQLVRDYAWRKALWVALLGLSQALRPLKVKGVKALDRWIIANLLVIAAVDVLIWLVLGPKALAYLALSTFFALGLHPVGGRWIQEHYETRKGQETYSYYGPLNQDLLQHGLSQRASRFFRHPLEQSAQAETARARVLRQPGVVPVVDRGAAQVHLRPLDVDLQPRGPGGAKAQRQRAPRAAAATAGNGRRRSPPMRPSRRRN